MLRLVGRLFIGGLFVAVPLHSQQCAWLEHAGNPIIRYGDGIATLAWNDVAVLKDGSQYRMWLAGGDPSSSNPVVKVYEATSVDDINWTINPTPQLSPTGNPRAWDGHRIETPNVIKVGTTYHLYYSGCTGSCSGQYSIGHATSKDGKKWTKDRNNPVITFTNDPAHWGYFTAGEPAPVYDPVSGTIFLYYSTVKIREGYDGPNPENLGWMQGIALATSRNGSAFQQYDPNGDGFRDAVLIQSDAYPVTSNYVGYSAPHAFLDSSRLLHLYYDVAQYPNPNDWRQVAIAAATSTDGFNFTETQTDLLTNGGTSWYSWEVRSPAVMQDGNLFKAWFAGHSGINDWTTAAIGYATSPFCTQ